MGIINQTIYTRIRIASISFKNELKAIFTDRGALLILLGAAFIYPVAYSIAYKNNVLSNIPVAVVDLDHTAGSRQLIRMLDATGKLDVFAKPASLLEAENLFWDDQVKGIILIENNFEQNLLKGHSANLGIYCDASYFLLYKETLTASLAASGTFAAGIEIRKLMSGGSSMEQAMEQINPLQTKYYMLYNPSGLYGPYVMPGIIIIILQQTMLIGIGMISGASREKKMKFMVPGIHYKGGTVSTIFGKALAYFLVMLFTTSITLVWFYDWFGFPSKCGYWEVLALLIPFSFSTIFLGLAISFLFQKREQSIMFLVFLSPIVLFMCGISWPTESMPIILQRLAMLIPGSFMVPAYLRLRTMGVDFVNVRFEIWALYVQASVYLALSVLFYKTMKKRQASGEEPRPKLSLRKKAMKKFF
jgi:ABC-2 type transport system permease protein